MSRSRCVIATGVAILSLGSLAPVNAEPSPPEVRQTSTGAETIVYSSRKCRGMEDYSDTGCTFELFRVTLDGSAPEPMLSTYGTDDVFPAYSPDGTEIAFNSWEKV